MQKRTIIKTYKFMIIVVVFLFLAIIGKLCYIVLSDTVDGINLEEKAASVTTAKKTLYAKRGRIFDINNETLATTVNSYTLIAYLSEKRTEDVNNPRHVIDKLKTAQELAPIIGLSEEKILERLNKEGAYQVEFGTNGKNLSEIVKNQILALDLPGIDFTPSTKRYYSKGEFAAYLLGFANVNENDLVSGLGIEYAYYDTLAGINGYKEYQRYTSGNYQIPNTPENVEEAIDGSDIYLTIDSNIQMILEKAMKTLRDNYEHDWGLITLMDASSGAIVGSATSPNFNPNDLNTLENHLNPLVSYQYEPGSVMKIFSFATSIEEGKYDGMKTYESGEIKVANVTIRDANRTGWGTISFDQGFANSSNVASSYLALDLGVPTLRKYYENLGFGQKTEIELDKEASGDINFLTQVDLASASFGQGITVTPIQMLQALSSITNNGVVIKPYIIEKIVDAENNIVYQGKKEEVKKVYSEKTIEKMKSLMHMAIYEGIATPWQPDNVAIMGKTGTAQIAGDGGYTQDKYVRSFAGIFPEENPEYIIYYVIQGFKGETKEIADILTNAVEEISLYSNLTQTSYDVDEEKIMTIKNYLSEKVSDVVPLIEDLEVVIIGDGNYIIDQYPRQKQEVLVNNKLFLKTNSVNIKMPNMIGWSMNEVKTYCRLVGITCELNGYGYVDNQNILENDVLAINSHLKINLKSIQIE